MGDLDSRAASISASVGFSLRRLERKLLRDDRVHADLDRTRAAALESLLGSGIRLEPERGF